MFTFKTALVLALAASASAATIEIETSDKVEDSDTKQFFGRRGGRFGFVRPFFMKPFPLSTNHRPTADTVPTAFDARKIGNDVLSALNSKQVENNRKADRFIRLFAQGPNSYYQENGHHELADAQPIFECINADGASVRAVDGVCPEDSTYEAQGYSGVSNGATGFQDLVTYFEQKYPGEGTNYHKEYSHWYTYTEKSFTAKSDGFILEWNSHANLEEATNDDGTRAEPTRIEPNTFTKENRYATGAIVCTVNQYGKIMNIRNYISLVGCDDC
jgi:hypothetical protein